MNKGRRNEITALKFKKRIKRLGLSKENTCYKHQTTPCSCFMCKPYKYQRSEFNKETKMDIIND